MSISRWKLMACSLGLSVGGLTMVAGQINNRLNAQWDVTTKPSPETTQSAPVEPLPKNKPAAARAAAETTPPAASALELELIVPDGLPVNPPAPAIAPAERQTGVIESLEGFPPSADVKPATTPEIKIKAGELVDPLTIAPVAPLAGSPVAPAVVPVQEIVPAAPVMRLPLFSRRRPHRRALTILKMRTNRPKSRVILR